MEDELDGFEGLPLTLRDACRRSGWTTYSEIQRNVLETVLNKGENKDDEHLVVVSPPKSGSIGAYLLPILYQIYRDAVLPNSTYACILCPSPIRARHIVSGIQKLSYFIPGLKCVHLSKIFSEQESGKLLPFDVRHQQRSFDIIRHIIVGSASHIRSHMPTIKGKLELRYIVLDSASELFKIDNFYEDYLSIVQESSQTPLVYLFTHIETPAVKNFSYYQRAMQYNTIIRCDKGQDVIRDCVFGDVKERIVHLLYFLLNSEFNLLVCTKTCVVTRAIKSILQDKVPLVAYMEDSMSLQDQHEELTKLKERRCEILVCSDPLLQDLFWIFPTMTTVINWGLPANRTDHYFREQVTRHAGLGGRIVFLLDKQLEGAIPNYVAHQASKLSIEEKDLELFVNEIIETENDLEAMLHDVDDNIDKGQVGHT